MMATLLALLGFLAVLAMLYGGLLVFAAANLPMGGDSTSASGLWCIAGGAAALVGVIAFAVFR